MDGYRLQHIVDGNSGPEAEGGLASSARILVVDDEMGIRLSCKRVLSSAGYEVDEAEDGDVGLQKVRAGAYDLLLIDMMRPGLGGLDLIGQVHEIDSEIILIVITGYPTIESTVEAMKRGAYDYMPKPFAPDSLLAVVKRGLQKRYQSLEAQTLRVERERRLLGIADEETRTRAIIGCMADGVLVTNREGRVVLWNHVAASMLGLHGTDTLGQPLEHYTKSEVLRELLAEADQPTMMRREIRIEEGGPTLMAAVAPVRDEVGEISGTVTVLSDISELKEIDTIKTQFVSRVAHELRAPLAAIKGWMDIILSGAAGEDPEQRRVWLERCRDRADSLLAWINDLLIIHRMEAGRVARNLEPLAMGEILTASAEFLKTEADDRQVSLELFLPADLPMIPADKTDMEHLCMNLIDNAIKYSFDGGKVQIKAWVADGFLHFYVKDTGVGITEEALSHLFEDFYRADDAGTRHIRGTGLGLSIARKIVESHGGRITVASVPGEGSTFTVSLPQDTR